ncbi:MAG: hypothetical protein ACI4GA_01390 [Acutalibacteraceae bacterium]|nr:hypothetical protein [Oscillospiraceae bacterium]
MSEDIKIYNGDEHDDSSDMSAVIEVMKEHRANGNIDKAKALGKELSSIDINIKKLLSPKFMKSDIIYQIKVLVVFAAELNLQMLISAPMLSTTAINSMYDAIQKKSEGFYSNISDGVAFSFYYACVRKGGDIAENIGQTFAMLCSAQDNESFIEAGKTVYEEALRIVTDKINAANFSLI